MAVSVYIETSVVSYFVARPSRDLVIAAYQRATQELWPRLLADYTTYISALVYDESSKGDPELAQQRLTAIAPFPMLEVDDTARSLAQVLMDGSAMPARFPEDALHIAVCAVSGVQILLTWNFTHLNNPFTRLKIRKLVNSAGYVCPEVCSPNELLELEP
ncbi:MAG: type II toxin-antitoxin system VapC family toxin [Candidatus Hydrogenedentes bacterium]|nr:type II toxin-antitoxin system VapC family toxin [Candidatus Hydrogenedentota bacterium]